MKTSLCITFLVGISLNLYSQAPDTVFVKAETQKIEKQSQEGYKIKPWIDIPLTVAVDAWSLYGMSVIYGRDPIPVSELLLLDKNNINKFDRPVADNYSTRAKAASDKFFYGSMPLPLLLLFDKKIRKDGLKVGLLYLETMGITGTIYTASAMIANRYRPYAYNSDVDINIRQRGGARNSFFAGHVAVVASSTFFMAQVYTHYHPDMKGKWVLFALAGAATATTGYLRMKAGQHFTTDVITGTIVGTLVGNLVPYFHRNKTFKNSKLVLLPNFQNGATGFTAFYKLGK